MLRSHRKIEFGLVAAFMLCSWFLFDTYFHDKQPRHVQADVIKKPWRYEAKEPETDHGILEQEIAHDSMKESYTSSALQMQGTITPTKSDIIATTFTPTPSPSLPDRVVVLAKIPKEDTSWVHSDLQDWQAVIYDIDTQNPHNTSTLDPLTNSTLRTLRNKGREANAYLAYIVQNYDSLPSTIAFVHAHKAGYPAAWHNDNAEYSNVISLRTLNLNFVQRNGYANLRCIHIPGCPDEVQPFRDPPEDHRTAEHAMPNAWLHLFNETNVPRVLGAPCCAQFAVSRDQVQKRPLDEYRRFYTWLMETPLNDETSGRVFEYLWHFIFGQTPV